MNHFNYFPNRRRFLTLATGPFTLVLASGIVICQMKTIYWRNLPITDFIAKYTGSMCLFINDHTCLSVTVVTRFKTKTSPSPYNLRQCHVLELAKTLPMIPRIGLITRHVSYYLEIFFAPVLERDHTQITVNANTNIWALNKHTPIEHLTFQIFEKKYETQMLIQTTTLFVI